MDKDIGSFYVARRVTNAAAAGRRSAIMNVCSRSASFVVVEKKADTA